MATTEGYIAVVVQDLPEAAAEAARRRTRLKVVKQGCCLPTGFGSVSSGCKPDVLGRCITGSTRKPDFFHIG